MTINHTIDGKYVPDRKVQFIALRFLCAFLLSLGMEENKVQKDLNLNTLN